MNSSDLKSRTLSFLRRYGHLDEPGRLPDFSAPEPPRYDDYRSHIHPWYRDDFEELDDLLREKSGSEIYKEQFFSTIKGLDRRTEEELRRMPFSDVPDSEEYALVDIGSHLGTEFTNRFASSKPHVRVFMVDSLTQEDLERKYVYTPFKNGELVEVFRYRPERFTGDVEEDVNSLLDMNGYRNVRYLQKEMKKNGSNLEEIESELRGKRLVFTGFKNPRELGTITLLEGISHGAERIYMNNTALENLKQDSWVFGMLKDYVKGELTEPEREKLVRLIYYPECSPRMIKQIMYDYRSNERYFATALKQLFSLAQADILESSGYDAGLALGFSINYNQSDHNFAAVRKDI
ncbi:MAG: hypothetical protein J7K54_01870 [Candidatus Aenigmarchaeota archaeon]|nr:hypothetical protein [Candidatus Aenigmarchaeota archaeon]